MGYISILLGILAFFCFTGAGAMLGNVIIDYKVYLSMAVTSLQSVSNTTLMLVMVGIFGFIGLLIGMNLIMHGINYNRLSRLQKTLRHRH